MRQLKDYNIRKKLSELENTIFGRKGFLKLDSFFTFKNLKSEEKCYGKDEKKKRLGKTEISDNKLFAACNNVMYRIYAGTNIKCKKHIRGF